MTEEVEALRERVRALELENIGLMRQHAETIVRERWIRDASAWIRERLDVESVTHRAVDELGAMLACDRVLIRLRDGRGTWTWVASWTREGVSPLGVELDVPPAFARVVAESCADRSPIVIDDLLADTRLGTDGPTTSRVLDARGVVVMPLAQDDQTLGELMFQTVGHPRPWPPSDVAMIEAMGHEISSALSHAQAYELARWVVAQLDELDRDKTDFLSSVSHELRTPLTSIIGYLEMLEDGDAGKLTRDQESMVGIIHRNSRRLLTLIEDLLTVSRIEANTFELIVTDVDVRGLVTAVADAVAPSVAERSLTLHIDVADDVGTIEGDAGQLERVVLNLASNAVKFTSPDGEVVIGARRDGDAV
jgi:two-component system phosphate regulon sensor histidine kinase PhoR